MNDKTKKPSRKASNKRHWYRYFYNMVKEFVCDVVKDDVGIYAAQAAFYISLSAVPSLMIIILCLKYFIDVDLDYIATSIGMFFPQQISDFVVEIVSEVFYRTESTAFFSVAFITLLWTSSKGTMAVYFGLNRIFGYTKEFSWIRMRILTFFYNILFFAVIIASLIVLAFGNTIINFVDAEFILAHYVISVLLDFKFVIFFAVLALGFAALFTFLPQRKTSFKLQLWGASAASAGWLLASYAFSLYLTYFSGYSYIYGSLAAVMLLALVMYFFMYILLIGAEINKHIESNYFKRLAVYMLRKRKKHKKK